MHIVRFTDLSLYIIFRAAAPFLPERVGPRSLWRHGLTSRLASCLLSCAFLDISSTFVVSHYFIPDPFHSCQTTHAAKHFHLSYSQLFLSFSSLSIFQLHTSLLVSLLFYTLFPLTTHWFYDPLTPLTSFPNFSTVTAQCVLTLRSEYRPLLLSNLGIWTYLFSVLFLAYLSPSLDLQWASDIHSSSCWS